MKFMPSGPYPVEIGFTVCPRDWAREMRLRKCAAEPFPKSDGCVTCFVQANGARLLVVTFANFRGRTLIERVGVAVHEATHVWQQIAEHINESSAGHEVEACSVQWITQWLLEQLESVGWLKR